MRLRRKCLNLTSCLQANIENLLLFVWAALLAFVLILQIVGAFLRVLGLQRGCIAVELAPRLAHSDPDQRPRNT